MEKLDKRIEELEEKLAKTVAGSKEAMALIEELDRLYQMRLREEKAIDERSDRNRQYDLQEQRYEAERREAAVMVRQKRWDRVWDVGKQAVGGVITVGSIMIVGAIEKENIIGQKLLNIAMKAFPKMF